MLLLKLTFLFLAADNIWARTSPVDSVWEWQHYQSIPVPAEIKNDTIRLPSSANTQGYSAAVVDAFFKRECAQVPPELRGFCERYSIKPVKDSVVLSPEAQESLRNLRRVDGLEDTLKAAAPVLDISGCKAGHAHASLALASKLEDYFPDTNAVQTTLLLLNRASTCGDSDVHTRAAYRLALLQIWQGKFELAEKQLVALLESSAARPIHARVKYWRYQCAMQLGNSQLAEQMKLSLLNENPLSFHNLLLNSEEPAFMERIDAASGKLSIAARSLVYPEFNAMLRLIESTLRTKPIKASSLIDQFRNDLRATEGSVRFYVAYRLHQRKLSVDKFKVMSDLFQDVPNFIAWESLGMYFPLKYLESLKQVTGEVDPLLMLSLIRQESAFNSSARSVAGARGLMQVMPATARHIASVRSSQLYHPDTNLKVGSKYFRHRLKQLDGDVELTLAAYNAGIQRVQKWKKRYPIDNKILFVDLIPFRETREYVSSIMRNYFWYQKLQKRN